MKQAHTRASSIFSDKLFIVFIISCCMLMVNSAFAQAEVRTTPVNTKPAPKAIAHSTADQRKATADKSKDKDNPPQDRKSAGTKTQQKNTTSMASQSAGEKK